MPSRPGPVYGWRRLHEPDPCPRYTVPAMIDITPNPLLGSLGPIEIRWYGIAYVAAIVGGTWLATHEARRRGERTDVILDGLIFLAVAALIGGRLYHVIDQWSYYSGHLAQIVLPPYSGLGVVSYTHLRAHETDS